MTKPSVAALRRNPGRRSDGSPVDFGALTIPDPRSGLGQAEHDLTTQLILRYQPILESETGKHVVAVLSGDSRVEALRHQVVTLGTTAASFDLPKLAMWFLWATNEYGPAQATRYLEEYLDASQIPVVNTLWIGGVEVASAIELSGGYRVVPIADMPNSPDKDLYLRKDIHLHPYAPAWPKAAVCRTCDLSKALPAGYEVPWDDSWHECTRQLERIALLLNAIGDVACVPYLRASYLQPTTPLGPFAPLSWGFPPYDIEGSEPSKLSDDMTTGLDELVAAFAATSPSERERLKRILTRLSLARRRRQIDDKILDLGISLEMALLDDNKQADQLALSFRVRGAWLVGGNGQERQRIFDDLRDLYDFRSQVAHTGALRTRSRAKAESKFSDYSRLAAEILRRLIIDGRPSWNSLILDVD